MNVAFCKGFKYVKGLSDRDQDKNMDQTGRDKD